MEVSDDVADAGFSERRAPESLSIRSKVVLAAGLGVPLGSLLAADPAAADTFENTGSSAADAVDAEFLVGPVTPDSAQSHVFGLELDHLAISGPVVSLLAVDSRSANNVEADGAFRMLPTEPVVVEAVENYVSVDPGGASLMGPSVTGFEAVFDSNAWLDIPDVAQSDVAERGFFCRLFGRGHLSDPNPAVALSLFRLSKPLSRWQQFTMGE